MTREIEAYQCKLEESLRKSLGAAERDKLFRLHAQKISEFQAERLVHLLVTLFFGVLTVCSYVLLTFTFGGPALLAGLLAMLLTALEGGYVLHYYKLENGLQQLYAYTEKILR